MKNILSHIAVAAMVLILVGCSRPSTPKPYGYYRLAIPQHQYVPSTDLIKGLPYSFSVSSHATITRSDATHPDYINIHYPSINSTIHCTYLPIRHNLNGLLADAEEMVYSHTVKASAIPEQEYADAAHHVYGVYYEFEGNTATSAQFFLTDSVHHFFRAAVYVNSVPNQDSLAPVIEFLKADARTMIESFQWQQ